MEKMFGNGATVAQVQYVLKSMDIRYMTDIWKKLHKDITKWKRQAHKERFSRQKYQFTGENSRDYDKIKKKRHESKVSDSVVGKVKTIDI